LARSIKVFGYKELAITHIPDGILLLSNIKNQKNISGVQSMWLNRYLPDGTFVQVSSIFNNDYISITSPIKISKYTYGGILLYLVTIAIPVNTGDGFIYYSDYDSDELFIWKPYTYTIDENTGILSRVDTQMNFTYNDYTTGSGLTLTLQEGYNGQTPEHYAQLSHMFSHEEEIGSLDWKNFQDGGGYDLSNLGSPDQNTYWGYSIVRFLKMATYGATRALKSPDPKTTLYDSYAARKNYVLDGDNVTYTDLVYSRNIIQQYFAPEYWDWQYGQAMFVGISEFLNPNYRWMFEHYISATIAGTDSVKKTLIATDEHELPDYPTKSGLDTSLNWKYHVPVMLVDDTKALMRIVERVGTNKTCWDATLNEKLVIGKSNDYLNLREITLASNGGITSTSVTGSDTIDANDSKGYSLEGCQEGDREWGVTGGGGASISSDGQLTTVNGCGVLTVTGTCVSCGISAQKTVIAPSSWKNSGLCTRNVGYCFPTSEWVDVYTDQFHWMCANALCPGSVDCNAAWDCTGSCTVGSCAKCQSGGLTTLGIFCQEYGCP
jgi:hypothetical protein